MDNAKLLGECLALWKNGDLSELLVEGRIIQARLEPKCVFQKNDHSSHTFAKLIFEGRTKAALEHLASQHNGGVLTLDDMTDSGHSVQDVLKSKHPPV